MNRVALVLQTPAVSLSVFDHPTDEPHDDPPGEIASSDCISFVDAGHFDIRAGRARVRLQPGTLFVTARGMEFECTHDGAGPHDRCLSVAYDERAVDDLRSAGVPALRPPVAALTPRQRWLRRRLTDGAAGDEVRLELIAGALFESLAPEGELGSRRAAAADPDVALVRRVERAVDRIESDFAARLTLRELAGSANLSAYHFARAFRSVTGVPPHRYLTAVRLAHAARRIHAGAPVSETCYAVGYGSLSHFITSFRERFGVGPTDVRRAAAPPALRAALARSARNRKRVRAGRS